MELSQISALLFVFSLLGGALWFVKTRRRSTLRFPVKASTRNRHMQVIERVTLTANHTLCLVRIGARMVAIGTAPSGCQLIDTVEIASEMAAEAASK